MFSLSSDVMATNTGTQRAVSIGRSECHAISPCRESSPAQTKPCDRVPRGAHRGGAPHVALRRAADGNRRHFSALLYQPGTYGGIRYLWVQPTVSVTHRLLYFTRSAIQRSTVAFFRLCSHYQPAMARSALLALGLLALAVGASAQNCSPKCSSNGVCTQV